MLFGQQRGKCPADVALAVDILPLAQFVQRGVIGVYGFVVGSNGDGGHCSLILVHECHYSSALLGCVQSGLQDGSPQTGACVFAWSCVDSRHTVQCVKGGCHVNEDAVYVQQRCFLGSAAGRLVAQAVSVPPLVCKTFLPLVFPRNNPPLQQSQAC